MIISPIKYSGTDAGTGERQISYLDFLTSWRRIISREISISEINGKQYSPKFIVTA